MTHLNIQQGSNVEIVTTQIIKKLYEAALSIPEPQSGEEDAAYMSGNLQVTKAYRSQVEYLTGRFDDLNINVTVGYYIDFEDSVLGNKLISVYSADGVGITEAEAANITITQGGIVSVKNEVTSFNEFNKFTKANTFTSSGVNSRFRDFVNMTSINLTALQYLNGNDFRNTRITVVNAPNLIAIGSQSGDNVFGQCTNLTTVESLGNITILPSNCFNGCTHLTTVNLPQSCTELRSQSFKNCTMLSSINLENVVTIGDSAFQNCPITGTLNLPNLTSLGGVAFANANITSIVDLGNLTSLEPRTFQNCTSLVSADLSNITSFGWSSFTGCSNLVLDVATLSTNTTFIGEQAFNGCTKVTGVLNLPNLTRMDSNAFRATGITSITSLGNLTSTPTWGFQNCLSLTTVTLPSGLTTIGRNCFDGDTSLTSIDLSNVTSIEMSAFVGCTSLGGTINLPNLTSLGQYSFCNTGITNITDLGNVTSIPKWCFMNCTSLTNVTLSSSITLIDDNCFAGCTALEWVKILYTGDNDNPIVGAGTDCFGRTGYSDHNTNIKIFVPDSRVNDYINASWFWNKYSSQIYPLSDFSTYFPNA